MKNKIIIGLIGEPAGGKGSVSNIIMEKHKTSHIATSDILKNILNNLHLEFSRENLTKLALSLKQTFGDQILMEALVQEVQKMDNNLVIVDGFRMPGDPEYFKEKYEKNFYLIYITADQRIRYERSIKRGEKSGESTTTFEKFQENEKKGTENSISEVAKNADFKIINNGDERELKKKVLEIIEKIY